MADDIAIPAERHTAERWYDVLLAMADKDGRLAETQAWLGRVDLWYLLTRLLGRRDLKERGTGAEREKAADFFFARAREVQASPNGHLDLWAREHGKSSLLTFGKTIQDILCDPEITVGFFSHTRPIAKAFLRQIKREFEVNDDLKAIYPDVLWADPRKQASKWSEDEGIVVKRKGNPKEATVEAWGLVDGMPTSKHYKLRVYDDTVTRESVTSPEMIRKVTEAVELSDNLSAHGGAVRFIGTRYHIFDTYRTLIDRGVVKPRIYPATHDGRRSGKPVMFTDAEWAEKQKMQLSTLNAQMLQNPLADSAGTFQGAWLKPWWVRPRNLIVHIMVDPSLGKTKRSDLTSIAVVGLDGASNKYLLDGMAHRMKLSERWTALRDMYRKWTRMPGINHVKVGYERYGLQSDLEYFEERMRLEKLHFAIEELNWVLEGGQSKNTRIERLEPDIRLGRFRLPGLVWLDDGTTGRWRIVADPEALTDDTSRAIALADKDKGLKPGDVAYDTLEGELREIREAKARGLSDTAVEPLRRIDENKRVYDFTRAVIDDLLLFPFCAVLDRLDSISRLYDMGISVPSAKEASADPFSVGADRVPEPQVYVDGV